MTCAARTSSPSPHDISYIQDLAMVSVEVANRCRRNKAAQKICHRRDEHVYCRPLPCFRVVEPQLVDDYEVRRPPHLQIGWLPPAPNPQARALGPPDHRPPLLVLPQAGRPQAQPSLFPPPILSRKTHRLFFLSSFLSGRPPICGVGRARATD